MKKKNKYKTFWKRNWDIIIASISIISFIFIFITAFLSFNYTQSMNGIIPIIRVVLILVVIIFPSFTIISLIRNFSKQRRKNIWRWIISISFIILNIALFILIMSAIALAKLMSGYGW